MKYRDRLVDHVLERLLSSTGAVVIEGPKACGKTETARQVAASEVLLDVDRNAREAIAIDPALVLKGETPRLIDEWQIEPAIWNHIRRTVDDRGKPGQFILTGSAMPADEVTRHTGAGRLTRLRLRPMTLVETGDSTGAVSLGGLLNGASQSAADSGNSIEGLVDRLAVGGWPGYLNLNTEQSITAVRSYLDEIRRVDVSRVEKTHRDPERVGRLLRSLARNVATEVSISTLAADAGGADGPLARDTVRDYLNALKRLMIYEDQPAWAPHLRSRSTLRKSAKCHFVDPSLAVAALRTTPRRLLQDLELLGLLFESMVIRDLRVYAEVNDATILHYRDNTGLEVDAVVEAADGRWCAFEIKLSPARIAEGAESLKKFANRVDTNRCGKPGQLGVIVSTGYAYVRKDGIAVIPIGVLGP